MDFLFLSQTGVVPGCPRNRRYAAMPAPSAAFTRRTASFAMRGHRGSAGPGALRRRQHRERGRLGQPEHSGPCGPRAGFCRNLCLSAGRTADGGRRGPAHRGVFEYARLLRTCPSACAHHAALIRNLLAVTSQKNPRSPAAFSTPRPKTIRGRLLSIFLCPGAAGKQPQLRYSSTASSWRITWRDRSALSAELGRMRGGPHPFPQNEFGAAREPSSTVFAAAAKKKVQ